MKKTDINFVQPIGLFHKDQQIKQNIRYASLTN